METDRAAQPTHCAINTILVVKQNCAPNSSKQLKPNWHAVAEQQQTLDTVFNSV
jgi:hypothetical protein